MIFDSDHITVATIHSSEGRVVETVESTSPPTAWMSASVPPLNVTWGPVHVCAKRFTNITQHTHTHTYIYIHIHTYICILYIRLSVLPKNLNNNVLQPLQRTLIRAIKKLNPFDNHTCDVYF